MTCGSARLEAYCTLLVSLAVIILFAGMMPPPVSAQSVQSPILEKPVREYDLLFSGVDDLNTVASLGLGSYAVLTDAYHLGLAPLLPEAIARPIGVAWQSWWVFMLTIWPHEFGHWDRAQQVGGAFVFEEFRIPWPKARMDLPPGTSLFSETLTSVGGFEINYLMRKIALDQYYSHGYSFANLLVHSFIQGIYYPAYAFIVAPLVSGHWIDPTYPETWTNTQGDPVESTLLVYRNRYSASVPLPGQPVDPRLVDYYRESLAASAVWTLLDPALYEGARAFAVDMGRGTPAMMPLMIGNSALSWMYGTAFNSSPLGYELWMFHHLRVNGHYLMISLRYGRPFANYGLGLTVPGLFHVSGLRIGFSGDYWYQEPFGHGFSGRLETQLPIAPSVSLRFASGWKSQGYLPGMPVAESLFLQGGLVFALTVE